MALANILLVEDERIVARDLQMILDKAGYRVVATAASGLQAILKAEETQPDLILMDVMLSDRMSGIDAACRIREKREIPIIYLTANGDQAVLEQAKATEPIAFILKPFSEPEILITIAAALRQYRTQQERARGGSLELPSAPGDGAPATVSLPLTQTNGIGPSP
jgi:CheY-like chemotaxis protein